MNSIADYSNLIAALPVEKQAGTIEAKNWLNKEIHCSKSKNAISKIFSGNQRITITREDLFESAKDDSPRIYFYKVLIWGYPRGLRGNNLPSLVESLGAILTRLRNMKNQKQLNWELEKKFIERTEGLGISTYSKLLYFMRCKIGDSSCLILDKRVIDALRAYNFIETSKLSRINAQNATKKYPEYLDIAEACGKNGNSSSDQVEMFLFYFGADFKFEH